MPRAFLSHTAGVSLERITREQQTIKMYKTCLVVSNRPATAPSSTLGIISHPPLRAPDLNEAGLPDNSTQCLLWLFFYTKTTKKTENPSHQLTRHRLNLLTSLSTNGEFLKSEDDCLQSMCTVKITKTTKKSNFLTCILYFAPLAFLLLALNFPPFF